MDILQMDEEYADRDLNVGFSGGEKKESRNSPASYVKTIPCHSG